MAKLVQVINKFADGTETVYNYTENAFADQIETEVKEAVAAKEPKVEVVAPVEEVQEFEPVTLG